MFIWRNQVLTPIRPQLNKYLFAVLLPTHLKPPYPNFFMNISMNFFLHGTIFWLLMKRGIVGKLVMSVSLCWLPLNKFRNN